MQQPSTPRRPTSTHITTKDAWQFAIFLGALCLVAAWFTRGYIVFWFVPAPLFAIVCGAFIMLGLYRAATTGPEQGGR